MHAYEKDTRFYIRWDHKTRRYVPHIATDAQFNDALFEQNKTKP